MSSMFDSDVRDRRNHTPWARMDLVAFMREMAVNDVAEHNPKAGEAYAVYGHKHLPVILSVRYRPDVASRLWWIVEWTGEDGQQHFAEGQELQLALWRAAEVEMRARRRAALEEGGRGPDA